jgi:hypothetical protein
VQILRSNSMLPELQAKWEDAGDEWRFAGIEGPPKGSWYTAGAVGIVQMLAHAGGGFVVWWKTKEI